MKITPQNFIVGTLAVVIVVLLLRNVQAFADIITTVTGIFGKSFKSVTEVGDFGKDV